MHSVFNKRGAFFMERKQLTNSMKWLTVVIGLTLLVQLHIDTSHLQGNEPDSGLLAQNSTTDEQSSQQNTTDEQSAQQCSEDEPLIVSIDQLLPPFLNSEGPGVRPVEPPPGPTTRILSDNDEFRLAHSGQLIAQQLAHSRTAYLLHLTQREQAGFYLYELCKLLI